MNDFLPLDDADQLIASLTGDPVFSGKARRMAGDGTLKISFLYRGPIGVFPIPKAPNEKTKAIKKYNFDGHLTAVARPRLDVPTEKISNKGIKKQLRDLLTVREVTLAQGTLPIEPGHLIGRLNSLIEHNEGKRTKYATDNLNSSLVPVKQWRIASDEIRAVFQRTVTDTKAADVGQVLEGATTAEAQGKKWTPEKLAELKAYRAKHGTKKAASHFNISDGWVRQLLPSEKPKSKGYSAYTHLIK